MQHKTLTLGKKFAAVATVAVLMLNATGCAPVILAGGSTAAAIVNDERSAGSFVEDQGIELKVQFQISEEIGDSVNVSATSYNRRVLLTGQVPNENTRRQVSDIVKNVENVRDVIDQLEIGNPSSLTSRASDAALTARVKSTLCGLQIKDFSCLDVKVVSEKGNVYLMGLVTEKQEKIATDAASHVSGVLKVNTLFEREN